MSRYYPANYFSFSPVVRKHSIKNIFRKLILKTYDPKAPLNKGSWGKLLRRKFPSLSHIPLTKDFRILDVGCGAGNMLFNLKELGMRHLLGIDPYLAKDIEYKNGLRILKKTVSELAGKWDLIMFHHSFEHMSDPFETLNSVSKLLPDGGYCLIGLPIVSSHAWEHYRENWAALDPPRHFFLHSIKSITLLAKKFNLELEKIVYDSSEFQFWASEQYRRDIPLISDASHYVNPSHSIFSKKEMDAFKKRAQELNSKNRGDQAAFYFRKR